MKKTPPKPGFPELLRFDAFCAKKVGLWPPEARAVYGEAVRRLKACERLLHRYHDGVVDAEGDDGLPRYCYLSEGDSAYLQSLDPGPWTKGTD